MSNNRILAFKAQKHNDVNYIVATAKYHQFPQKQGVKKEPVYLTTRFEVSQDYTVLTVNTMK